MVLDIFSTVFSAHHYEPAIKRILPLQLYAILLKIQPACVRLLAEEHLLCGKHRLVLFSVDVAVSMTHCTERDGITLIISSKSEQARPLCI